MRAPALPWLRFSSVLALGLFGASLAAQSGTQTPANPDPMLRNMAWRNLGNANLIGRISAVDALEDDWTYVVVGSAAGGVLKSENGGTTWESIFDTYGAASIGDVKIFQKDKNLIWVGTGEGHQRNTAAWGDGVYKSTDGGDHFENVGLKDTYNIGRIRLHPTNKDIVYVAALGNIWGAVGSRGMFKTIDGGKTWTKLTNGLPSSPMSGADGLVMDPTQSGDPVRLVLGPHPLSVGPHQRRQYAGRARSAEDRGRQQERRHLQERGRRQDVEEAHRRASRRSSAASAWPSPRRIRRS